MMLRYRIIRLLVVFVTLVVGSALPACLTDPFPGVELPVHPDAIDVKRLNNNPAKGAKAVVYFINVPFPASDIIEFHVKELTSMGYLPFTEPLDSLPSRLWVSFNHQSGKYEETNIVPAKYKAIWVNNVNDTIVWLYIRYQPDTSDPAWVTRLIVSCHIVKYSAYEEERQLLSPGTAGESEDTSALQ